MAGSQVARPGYRAGENGAMRVELTLDCTDLDRAAEFWQAAAGFVVDGVIEGRYVTLTGRTVSRSRCNASRSPRP